MIHLIMGAPGTGKSHAASNYLWEGRADRTVCTDMFSELPWNEQSAAIVGALALANAMPSIRWVFEGFSLVRGVRKYFALGLKFNDIGDVTVLHTRQCDRWTARDVKAVTTIITSCEPLYDLVTKGHNHGDGVKE